MKFVQTTSPSRAFKTSVLGLFIFAIIALSSGCNSKTKATPDNFTQTLNAHFLERSECLFVDTRFPYATSDPVKTKQMNTLVKSLLLDVSFEYAVHTSRYTPYHHRRPLRAALLLRTPHRHQHRQLHPTRQGSQRLPRDPGRLSFQDGRCPCLG